jgi:hypothetical protein
LFAIRKVGQRKTLSGQRKTLFSQRKYFPVNGKHFPVKEKFGLVFRKIFSLLAVFVFRKMVSRKPLSKLSCVFLPLEKLVNEKHFPIKEKFDLIFRKVFSFYFGRKTLFRSCEKFKNKILFADYVKFGPQIFYCYIFCLNTFSFKFIP